MISKDLRLQHKLDAHSYDLTSNSKNNCSDNLNESRFSQERSEARNWKWGTVSCDRVARVTKGGKRYSFRYTVAVGDKRGKIGIGVSSDKEPRDARKKAVRDGRKKLVLAPLTSSMSIPHEVIGKFQSAKVLLRPLARGEGIRAGRTARVVLQLGGITDVMSKQLGSSSRLHNARAVSQALRNLREI